jgi:peptidyl-prolyl cis-trans isomerase D
MFDFVRKHTRILQLLLLILILPSFVVFGIQGYDSFLNEDEVVAKVAGQKVTASEMDLAHRRLVERIRSQQPNVDAARLDSPEVKRSALDSLLMDKVMLAAVNDQRLIAPETRIQRLFYTSPDFAQLRNADGSLNTKLLESQGITSAQFAERMRQQISLSQVTGGIEGTAAASATSNKIAVDSLFQVRDVQWLKFEARTYAASLNPTPEQLKKFFDEPKQASTFMLPERADVQYVVLDLDALKGRVTVSEEELRKYYQENLKLYTRDEERRASHILIKADKAAPADARKAARAKAEALLAEVRKTPAVFAELARKNSEDEGSAQNGGDLDFFGRGAMVKPFEDATFALKKGEISGVVESDFGFHIILLTDVRGGVATPFETARPEIEDNVRKQLAQRLYAESAEKFTNAVYEQSDSLKGVADELKLSIQTANGVVRVPTGKDAGVFGNIKLLESLFDATNRSKARNTEAIEVGPNKLVSARVVKHYPSARPAFETVQAQIKERWVAVESAKAAQADATQKLTLWQKNPAESKMPDSLQMSRRLAFAQPAAVLDAVMRIPEKDLPAWKVVDLGAEGAALIKVNKILPPVLSPEELLETQRQFGAFIGKAEAAAYAEALKREYKLSYTPKAPAKASEAEKASQPK